MDWVSLTWPRNTHTLSCWSLCAVDQHSDYQAYYSPSRQLWWVYYTKRLSANFRKVAFNQLWSVLSIDLACEQLHLVEVACIMGSHEYTVKLMLPLMGVLLSRTNIISMRLWLLLICWNYFHDTFLLRVLGLFLIDNNKLLLWDQNGFIIPTQ